ncbi:non-ribosomal peptide synthetase, partial [uncultured Aquimarina sp.]|uniref:non-ribosomal peptide synthetase n=2 Tax=uncultured Aquimarina sp. TaxID=575652 RepID=UPI0026147E2E
MKKKSFKNKHRKNSFRQLPMSDYQKRFFVEWSLAPNESNYNVSSISKIVGKLDKKKFKDTCEVFIEQNEIVHSRYSLDGNYCNYYKGNIDEFYYEFTFDSKIDIYAQIKKIIFKPFDLTKDRLFKLYLIKDKNRDEFYFIMLAHHIIFDANSLTILYDQIENVYNLLTKGEKISLDGNVNKTFTEAIETEQKFLNEDYKLKAKNFWYDFIGDTPLKLELPYQSKVNSTNINNAFQDKEGEFIFFDINYFQKTKLKNYTKRKKTTVFIVLSAIYAFILSKYSNQNSFLLTYPVSLNPKGFKNTVGCFVNNLLFKIESDKINTFNELLEVIKSQRKKSKPFQRYSTTDIIRDQRKSNKIQSNDLFNVGFAQTSLNGAHFKLKNLEISSIDIPWSQNSIYELALFYDEYSSDSISFRLEYRKALFDKNLIEELINSFKECLDKLINSDEDIDIKNYSVLPSVLYDKIVYSWNVTDVEYPKDETIVSLFESQVVKNPNQIALVHEGQQLTYKELNEKSNQLAIEIRKHYEDHMGLLLQPDTLIALCLGRSLEMVIGILGVLKAGGAYVPIDLNYPQERIDFILKDTEAALVLTQSAIQKDQLSYLEKKQLLLIDLSEPFYRDNKVDNIEIPIRPKDLCYVIYTSGTTGTPKGVMQPHGNVIRLFSSSYDQFNFSVNDVWTMYHSYVFDFSVWELWGALLYSGKLIIPSIDQIKDLHKFYKLCKQYKVTVLNQTPSAFYQFLDILLNYDYIHFRYIVFGGEALNPVHIGSWWDYKKEKDLNTVLVNMYGITETTVHVTYKELRPQEDTLSNIGKPISDLKAYVLDNFKNPVPIGIIGELYIGGAGIARGYLNRKELTQERFITNPFATDADKANGYTRMYKTGDLVRWLSDGNIEYIGRNDNQVKIRGYRIELAEIETVLSSVKGIAQSCVLAKGRATDKEVSKYLVGYYVLSDTNISIPPEDLIEELSKQLPEYMIPIDFVAMEEFPMTINGKLDKQGLPNPEFSSPDNYVAPDTKLEKELCSIWTSVLGVEKIGVTDDFFLTGGDSILSIRLVSKMKEININLSVKELFEYRTIERILSNYSYNIVKKEFLYRPFSLIEKSLKDTILDRCHVSLDQIQDIYPASYLQTGMIIESLLDASTYHDVFSYSIAAEFNYSRFEQIWSQLIDKHEQLRSSLKEINGKYFNVIFNRVAVKPKITCLDEYSDLQTFVNTEKLSPIDLSIPGLFRLFILQSNKTVEFTLVFSFHHAITDGWSVASLISKFVEAYVRKKPIISSTSSLSYGKFVAKEQEALNDVGYLKFWEEYLSGYQSNEKRYITNLDDNTSNYQVTIKKNLEPSINEGVLALANKLKVSPDIIFLGVYNLALSYYYGTVDMAIGVVVNNRLEDTGGDKLFGLHLNTIPSRFKTNNREEFINDYFLRVFNDKLNTNDYKIYPYGKIKSDLNYESDIYNCLFNYVHFHVMKDGYESGDFSLDFSHEKVNTPLVLNVIRMSKTFMLNLVSNTKIIETSALSGMLDYMTILLEQFIEDCNRPLQKYHYLPEKQLRKIIHDWNATEVAYDIQQTISTLFEKQVVATPDSTALVYKGEQLSYTELNQKSNQLALEIRKQYKDRTGDDLPSDTLIPLCLDRSFEMIIAILAVLKAGGAYVPIDPEYPQERIDYIIKDTNAKLILTQEHLLHKNIELPKEAILLVDLQEEFYTIQDNSNLTRYSKANDLAYVIYTSGTTGKPKGVMVEHKAVNNTISDLFTLYKKGIKTTAYTSYVFDVSVSEIFTSLLQGSELHILSDTIKKDSLLLSDYFVDNKINLVYIPPVLLDQLPQKSYPDLNVLIYAGEPCSKKTAKRWSSSLKLFNYYGPTETSIYATFKQILKDETEQIGHPIQNTQLYVLDNFGTPVPIGVIGELYIGGAGVARGYLNREELTKERFVQNPFATESDIQKGYTRLYKTGDLVRWLEDGNLEYIGRNDDQVKIRGYRIELGEIEAALSTISGITQSCVLVKQRTTDS